MKVSRKWLQEYFDTELPSAEALADALTFHAFEIETVDGEMLDVKVLPDRACYALSHRGIAKEISAILDIPMKTDPLREALPEFPSTDKLVITCDERYVLRHTGAIVRGVTVGPSPDWLKNALESVGQRSINNVVDVLNFVMLNTGQPSGGFDMGKLELDGEVLKIDIREAKDGEKITVLTGEEHTLKKGMYVFTDAMGGSLLDIAGIKGGKDSGVTESTKDLFISAGNYDGTLIRRAAQALKLFTDAGSRFQNRVSPELTVYGMRDILALLTKVAGGEVEGVVDWYPASIGARPPVSITVAGVNGRLGSTFSEEQVLGALTRLGLPYTKEGETIVVTAPFERGDISIPEDLSEEVGRIIGYENVASVEIPVSKEVTLVKYNGIERIKDLLTAQGFTEISTPSFAEKGDILLSNPLQEDKPYLRSTLTGNMQEALTRAANVAPKVLGPATEVKLFELGTIFTTNGEYLALVVGSKVLSGKKRPVIIENADTFGGLLTSNTGGTEETNEFLLSDADLTSFGKDYAPERITLGKFEQFSLYPFALRDIAVWTLEGTSEEAVASIIQKEAGPLLVRLDLFDSFAKDGKVSYAFRLVLEANDRTLTDTELNGVMERVTKTLSETEGYTVR